MAKFVKGSSHINSKTCIQLNFQVGRVIYISAKEIIETDDPHYFIVVAKCDRDNGYLLVSTTQKETITKYFKSAGIKDNTIATLSPNSTNGLKDYSYFNCNKIIPIDAKFLESKLDEGMLEPTGYLNAEEYLYIKGVIEKSDIVEPVIKKLLSDDYDVLK